MTLKRGTALLGVTGLVILHALSGAAQSEQRFKVRLSTVAMDGGMRSTVAGTGSATGVLKGTTLTVDGTFDGLLSPATTAKVHRGPAMGVRGPSIAELVVPTKAAKGTISGSVTLSPEQLRALQAGQLYLQISSEKAPEGNLWGWFVR
jgi:CHRD domain-containing protein